MNTVMPGSIHLTHTPDHFQAKNQNVEEIPCDSITGYAPLLVSHKGVFCLQLFPFFVRKWDILCLFDWGFGDLCNRKSSFQPPFTHNCFNLIVL